MNSEIPMPDPDALPEGSTDETDGTETTYEIIFDQKPPEGADPVQALRQRVVKEGGKYPHWIPPTRV